MRTKTIVVRSMFSIFIIAVLSGGVILLFAIRHAMQLEYVLQDNILVFNLVAVYIEQNDGVWPRSWDDLKKTKLPYSKWPDNYDQVRKNVIVDFDVKIEDLKDIPVDQFRAIRPSSECAFLDPEIEILQDTIRTNLKKQKIKRDEGMDSERRGT